MNDEKSKPATVDDYIAAYPADIQAKLQQMRETIKAAAPEAVEAISYGMPTFKLKGNLVHFAAHTHHIGLYPLPSAIEEFEDELAIYQRGKGSIQFPFSQPLPLELIGRMVRYRVAENLAKKKK